MRERDTEREREREREEEKKEKNGGRYIKKNSMRNSDKVP